MTPEFAAPEQQAGGPVTPATDVYALGILLERLLGGRPAGEIEPIIRRARASDPERRYASAAELLEELRRVRGGRAPRPPRRRLQLPGRRTLRRPSLLAVALLVLVLAGVAGLLLRQPAEAARADTIAVLPFSYSGSGEHAYLSEGLVSLLSANLDGIDGLRAVEPRALHGIIAQQAGESPSNSALARRLRAALFVAGDILEAGGQLRISAVLHDREGSVLLRATVAGSGEELFTLLQELSARLLAGRLEGGNEQLARNAALTTRSLPALRSYLEGERALRTGQFTAAVDAFDAAVTEDPEFALAHYRLSTAAVWTTRSMLALPSAERALRLAPRLEPIDSLRVVGWHRYLAGDPVWAAHFFHAVTSARPDDVDGWFQLGEVQFHWMPTLGRPATDARAAFERVLEFEPDNAGALIHLVRIAALEGRTAELDSLATRLARIEPGGTRALEARALLAFARRDGAEQQRVAAELRRSDPGRAVPILTLAAAAALDPRGAARWAHELARGPHPERDPAFVLSVLALAAAGRAGDAAAELDAWASVLPQAAHELRAALLLAPLLEPSARQLAAAREALARVPPAQGVLSLPVSDFSPIPQPHVRAYLLGMLSLRLGDASDALAQARRLEAWQGIDRDRRWAREFSRLIRAEMLRRERRAEEALRLLGPPAVAPDSLLPALLSHPKAHERWLRAELHRELGDDAEALRWYASFPDPIAYDLAYLAPSLLRRAEIHARRGERAQAAAHYRRFLELWRDADPELQPLVIRARRALERE